jgi:hypothetical protein
MPLRVNFHLLHIIGRNRYMYTFESNLLEKIKITNTIQTKIVPIEREKKYLSGKLKLKRQNYL